MNNEPSERGKALCLVVMGVTGAGKSTLAAALGARLGIRYVDADGYHPTTNVEKMKRGEPLTDDDRVGWLTELRRVLDEAELGEGVVLACSALKDSYRRVLGAPTPTRRLVFIQIDPEVARRRVARRKSHFMPMTLVESQFSTLQPPRDAIVVDATWPVQKAVNHVRDVLQGTDKPQE